MATRRVYEIEVSHKGLNKYRHIRGTDRYVVEQKAAMQKRQWDEQWGKKIQVEQIADQKRRERESIIQTKEAKKELASTKTEEAKKALLSLQQTLQFTLAVDDRIEWDSLLDKSIFSDPKPIVIKSKTVPAEPKLSDAAYQPRLNFIDRILSGRMALKKQKLIKQYYSDHKLWTEEKEKILATNRAAAENLVMETKKWERRKYQFEEDQRMRNEKIKEHKHRYFAYDPDAITDYCELVLSHSQYPDFFPREWDIQYNPESKILVIDYSLPNEDDLPTIKAVKYIASQDDFSETHLTPVELSSLYDDLLYQICLRTIHEIYEADVINAIASVVFNGWVNSIDKATGNFVNACIMSMQASKDEFLAINLAKVDPKTCFKQLKGVGSSKLHGLSPIAPIISLDKEDKRFVAAYDVADSINDSDNLATMDWQDFEHLIREMFHKEFSASGGEVKITQASRDGGVDAVAFDPDPIRGGKIVIQAKRYANVVGVSAVRDLYGTTMNEGATKGILVTTSDYGPDAYEFARGKPLTLLNGANLLHLLEKHGHKAKIDLKEAKKLNSELFKSKNDQ